jgi:hypothetical protein
MINVLQRHATNGHLRKYLHQLILADYLLKSDCRSDSSLHNLRYLDLAASAPRGNY